MSNELKSLSEKELAIVKLIATECLRNKELGTRLHTSQKNIEKIKSNIYEKLEVNNSMELVRFYFINNLT